MLIDNEDCPVFVFHINQPGTFEFDLSTTGDVCYRYDRLKPRVGGLSDT